MKFFRQTARNKKIYLVFQPILPHSHIVNHFISEYCAFFSQMWLVCLFCENWFSNCHKIKFWLNEILSSNYSRTIYTHTHKTIAKKKNSNYGFGTDTLLTCWTFSNIVQTNETREREKKTDAKILEILWTIKESICFFHQIEHVYSRYWSVYLTYWKNGSRCGLFKC